MNTQPVGQLVTKGNRKIFRKGIRDICIPPNSVSLATEDDLKKVFFMECDSNICFSTHRLNENIVRKFHRIYHLGNLENCSIMDIIGGCNG